MVNSSTVSRDRPQTQISVESVDTDELPDHRPHIKGFAAYYRLRSIALETRVATLEAELERARKRHRETIARYEEILQDRPERGCVVTVAPGVDSVPETDD